MRTKINIGGEEIAEGVWGLSQECLDSKRDGRAGSAGEGEGSDCNTTGEGRNCLDQESE
jgi:hypothetical protein